MAKRIWKQILSPAQLHEQFGVYQGIWMPQMDRCWMSDDGLQVTSRLLMTDWGKVEHAAITVPGTLSFNGEHDLPWAVKMDIKNELFGMNRLAIEVYPKDRNLVDVVDVYHLWIFPKDFDLPFGIHPKRDKQGRWIKRGCPKDISHLIDNTKEMLGDFGHKQEMPEKELREIADKAELIVNGYAFSRLEAESVSILNLNYPDCTMVVNKDGEIIKTNMDPIEQKIVLDLCRKNLQFLET